MRGAYHKAMLTNEFQAARVSQLMLEISRNLDQSLHLVEDSPPDEQRRYKRAVGRILGEILCEVLNPLYAQHPSLKPPGLD
jgi:hypothetical protein